MLLPSIILIPGQTMQKRPIDTLKNTAPKNMHVCVSIIYVEVQRQFFPTEAPIRTHLEKSALALCTEQQEERTSE